ncbi:hypothetical protein Smp_209020 [Schistosoma mansoni]|nr:hypothetical protein Smp_209020 [Schistosoma mansoni]|eukprot:XP_018647558.1 hypothetical protein Smp_209020 [Schistosoma mansoni]
MSSLLRIEQRSLIGRTAIFVLPTQSVSTPYGYTVCTLINV